MNQRAKGVLTLLVIFAAAFSSVFLLKNTQHGQRLIDEVSSAQNGNGYSSEAYHLQANRPINLSQVEVLEAINRESAALVKAVVPSVVSIDTKGVQNQSVRDVFGRTWVQPRAVQGQGSGAIVTREGHVLTNYHVVKGEPVISVTMSDGSIHEARLIGADPAVDIAVLKIIDSGPFVPLKFGDSSQIEVGNIVYAVGSPFGLGESVTDGMISAKKRSFTDSQVDLLQTSAAINPGNSGGPLVNIFGEIVGINSRIYSTDKDNPGFQGIGFAIPSNDALKTMQDILARGRPIRGFLGMALAEMGPNARRILGYSDGPGVRIYRILPNSPAMHAGLLENDVIISFGGEKATDIRRVIALVQQGKVGSRVELEIWRDKKKMVLTSIIGEANAKSQVGIVEPKETLDIKSVLTAIGLYVRDVSAKEQEQGLRGVIVARVDSKSSLHGKLQEGDVVRAINGNYALNSKDFLTQLAQSATIQDTELFVLRGKARIRVTISKVE